MTSFAMAYTDLPKLDVKVRCPDHPKARRDFGFGLAGGGYGTYTYCSICCMPLTKTCEPDQDPVDEAAARP